MELFFDVETTDLPQRGSSCTNLNAYDGARIVSFAWVLRSKHQVLSQHYCIVRQEDNSSREPLGASFIHGISRNMASEFGEDLKDILKLFLSDVGRAEMLVAHNWEFDANVVASEMFRLGMDPTRFLGHTKHCTMKANTDLVKASHPKFVGYKWPKLSELYYFCFRTEMKLAHNALADAENTAKCFYFVRDNMVDLTDSVPAHSVPAHSVQAQGQG